MKDIKKTLKLAGVLSLVINVLNISNLMLAIFVDEFSVFAVVEESICIVLTFVTGITYLCLMKKNKEHLIQHKGVFLALTLINIFNSIFVWIIALWVEIAISNIARIEYMKQVLNKTGKSAESGDTIDLNECDYEIKKETENLSESLKELDNLKSKKLISEEEYNELRQSLINKFLNKQ